MTWMLDLVETYDENSQIAGIVEQNRYGTDYALLPVSHVYQEVHIEVSIDFDGNFVTAEVVPKEKKNTIIPCTIASANRTSGVVPHPLHDKLMYVAGDFSDYGGVVKNPEKHPNPHHEYLKQLEKWVAFDPDNQIIKAIHQYLKQGHLIRDLVEKGVLYADGGKLVPKWSKEYQSQYSNKPAIFTVLTGDQLSSVVRFSIYDPDKIIEKPWHDQKMFQSFIAFYDTLINERGLCYVIGKEGPMTDKHPSKIRYGGDMAKLISGNDNRNFTFRGRFSSKDQVATISYEASQKAHNALKWLITRQGQLIDGRVFLTWGKQTAKVVNPLDSFFEQFGLADIAVEKWTPDTHEFFAMQFRNALLGYKANLDYGEKVVIMVLDAATPGRMSVMYYQNLDANLYLERINQWQQTAAWKHYYKMDDQKKPRFYYGVPTPRDIALATYGSHANEQVIKKTVERLLPCIIEGQPVPSDIVQQLVRRAVRPKSMEDWEWRITFSTACSMVRKFYEEEHLTMELNKENTDINYLLGRYLAVMHHLEKRVLDSRQETRATNAMRYMDAFAVKPSSTLALLRGKIAPYYDRLDSLNQHENSKGRLTDFYNKKFQEISELLEIGLDEVTDKPLNGKFVIGFDCQLASFYKGKNDKKIDDKEEQK